MCDDSLQTIQSRPAKVGDKLTTHNFGAGTRGFAAQKNPAVAVCLLPGTELAFSEEVAIGAFGPIWSMQQTLGHKTAIFRQINKNVLRMHHDALEFSDGRIVLLTDLSEGQEASVLQLPAQPMTQSEVEEQRRVEYIG